MFYDFAGIVRISRTQWPVIRFTFSGSSVPSSHTTRGGSRAFVSLSSSPGEGQPAENNGIFKPEYAIVRCLAAVMQIPFERSSLQGLRPASLH